MSYFRPILNEYILCIALGYLLNDEKAPEYLLIHVLLILGILHSKPYSHYPKSISEALKLLFHKDLLRLSLEIKMGLTVSNNMSHNAKLFQKL